LKCRSPVCRSRRDAARARSAPILVRRARPAHDHRQGESEDGVFIFWSRVRNIISNCVSPSPRCRAPLAPYIWRWIVRNKRAARDQFVISLNFSEPTVLASERHRHCGSNPAPIARIPATAICRHLRNAKCRCDAAIEKLRQHRGNIMRVRGRGNLSDMHRSFRLAVPLDHGVDETRPGQAKHPGHPHNKMPIFSCTTSFLPQASIRRKR